MTILIILWCVLVLWLTGLTWYVVRLALAPVPETDIHAALRSLALTHVRALAKTSPGRELLRQRLEARKAKP